MTLSSRIVLTVLLAAAGSAGAQQQWGPPAQSKLYHDPAHTPTYTAYNTSTRSVTAPAPVTPTRQAAPVARPVVRHRTTVRRSTTTAQY